MAVLWDYGVFDFWFFWVGWGMRGSKQKKMFFFIKNFFLVFILVENVFRSLNIHSHKHNLPSLISPFPINLIYQSS